MSTTVSYKGQTLATVSNDTKTLLTEGKYLEDDLTLIDVSGGGAVLGTKNITANGTYEAEDDSLDGYSEVNVAVPASAVDSGTKNITANGNGQDVVGYAAVNVNVPNSYSVGDEGKVVSNGALVSQGSDTVTANDTYDTTLISSLTVNVSGGGGEEVALNDVNFIDYDGTVVASYSAADFANLSELPSNPSHSGLTAQGWNWALTDAKNYVARYGSLIIGQSYTTSDGKTRIYIHIDPGTPTSRQKFTVRFQASAANNTTIDWGDGTTETKGSTSATSYSHSYSDAGDYTVTLTVNSGTINLGNENSSINRLRIKRIEIGQSVVRLLTFANNVNLQSVSAPNTLTTIDAQAFDNCDKLKAFVIPSGVTTLGNQIFRACYSLGLVSIPKTVTSMGSMFFQNCHNLYPVSLPESMASFGGNSAFENCRRFTKLIIPKDFTALNGYMCNGCDSMAEYHMHPTTPPTYNTSALNVPSDCIIYVPYSADHSILNSYKTASNWSTHASKMQEEAQ